MSLFYKAHGKKIWFCVVFVFCLSVGTWLSLSKPLWNDEIYTQERAIDQLSYKDILLVKFVEGNNSPLFYIMQKGVCDLAYFKLPMEWKGEWYLSNPKAQVIMRIAPNIFMSLTIAMIFYFFARYYSYGLGVYSLLVTFSSVMIWTYWAEARPYALWIFLTTAQSLLFLRIIKKKEHVPRKYFVFLSIVHILLSLSVVLSMGQIFIISLLVLILKDRKDLLHRRYAFLFLRYVFLALIPLAICFFYYFCMPASIFRYCVLKPAQLILANVPPDRIIIFFLYVGFLVYCFFRKEAEYKILFTKSLHPSLKRQFCYQGATYLLYLIFMTLFAVVILFYCKMREVPEQQTISLSDRYFMFLAPIEIIATILFSGCLVEFFKKKFWILINLSLVLGGLLTIRYIRAAMCVLAFYN